MSVSINDNSRLTLSKESIWALKPDQNHSFGLHDDTIFKVNEISATIIGIIEKSESVYFKALIEELNEVYNSLTPANIEDVKEFLIDLQDKQLIVIS